MAEKMGEQEKTEAIRRINEYYGSSFTTEFTLLKKDEKDGEKIFIYSGGEIPKLPLEWVGLHLATIAQDVLLSIEGAQMVGKTAAKTIEITRQQADELMRGLDLNYAGEIRGYVILKQAQNIIGVCIAEEGKITNTLPKSRRTVRNTKEEIGKA